MWVRSVVGIEMILAHTVTSVAAEFFHVFFEKLNTIAIQHPNKNSATAASASIIKAHKMVHP